MDEKGHKRAFPRSVEPRRFRNWGVFEAVPSLECDRVLQSCLVLPIGFEDFAPCRPLQANAGDRALRGSSGERGVCLFRRPAHESAGVLTEASPEFCFRNSRAHVHVLYKRPEIPANTAIPAFADSATYRRQEMAANPGSTPVSATNPFRIICLQK